MSPSVNKKKKCDSFRPIFIVGASRSGTTMMGRIVGNSKTIFTFNELHFFEQLWDARSDDKATLAGKQAVRLGARLLAIEREGYLARNLSAHYLAESAEMLTGGEDFWERICLTAPQVFCKFLLYESKKKCCENPCDQTPRNVFYLQEIFSLYPGARVINMVRDPRNVLLSQKRKWRRRFLGARNIPLREAIRAKVNYHPIVISKLWCSAVNAADLFPYDSRVHVVRFEDLLAQPEQTIRIVCNFLTIPYHPDLLDIPQTGSSNNPDQSQKRGVNIKLESRHKIVDGLTESEIFWCQMINKNKMKKYDYPLLPVRPRKYKLLLDILVFPFQSTLALALNINRAKNIFSTIKKRLI